MEAASIPEPVLRDRHLELFFDEASARMEEIQEAMRGAGWKTARTGLSVMAAIPGVKILGLVGTCGMFSPERVPGTSRVTLRMLACLEELLGIEQET